MANKKSGCQPMKWLDNIQLAMDNVQLAMDEKGRIHPELTDAEFQDRVWQSVANAVVEAENKFLKEICSRCLERPYTDADVGRFAVVQHNDFSNQFGLMFDGEPVGMIIRIYDTFPAIDFTKPSKIQAPEYKITFVPGEITFRR